MSPSYVFIFHVSDKEDEEEIKENDDKDDVDDVEIQDDVNLDDKEQE